MNTETSSVIEWVGTTTTSATTEKFVARDKFRLDSTEIKIYQFYITFKKDFLFANGKIEKPLNKQKLRYGNLTKEWVDNQIIEELGGEVKVETTLAELYALLKKQPNGEVGYLKKDGSTNIFYIRNIKNVLRAVSVHWYDDGWDFYSNSIKDLNSWFVGSRIFARAA